MRSGQELTTIAGALCKAQELSGDPMAGEIAAANVEADEPAPQHGEEHRANWQPPAQCSGPREGAACLRRRKATHCRKGCSQLRLQFEFQCLVLRGLGYRLEQAQRPLQVLHGLDSAERESARRDARCR